MVPTAIVGAFAGRALPGEEGEGVLVLVALMVAEVAGAHDDWQLRARVHIELAVDVLVGPLCHAAVLAVDDDSVIHSERHIRQPTPLI